MNTSIILFAKEIGAFVGHQGFITQSTEAVGESFWHEEHPMIFFAQDHRVPLTIGGRAFTDIDGHIENLTA